MNERIRELIQKMNSDVGIQWINEHKEKFAELIVRECIQVAHKETEDSVRIEFAIQTHFGIE